MKRFDAIIIGTGQAGPSQRWSRRKRTTIMRGDGQAPQSAHGVDVDEQGNGTVTVPRMYQLIRQPSTVVDREFEIEFLNSGVGAFSFTFG